MKVRSLLILAGVLALGGLAWRAGGWQGLALAGSALVLWVLLSFTRMMTVFTRASRQPVGYVGSAVMLNAKLKPGLSLLHVLALTRSIGQRLSEGDEQPEIYRWSDPGLSHVTAQFQDGRLKQWQLERPAEEADAPQAASPPA